MNREPCAPIGGSAGRGALTLSIVLVVTAGLAGGAAAAPAGRAGRSSPSSAAVTAAGQPYRCAPGADGTIAGAFGDASAIGWQGNAQGVVACLGDSFYVQDGLNTTYGYGIYNNSRTTWTNADAPDSPHDSSLRPQRRPVGSPLPRRRLAISPEPTPPL